MYTSVRARPPSAARRTYGGSGSQRSHAVRLAWAWRRAMRCCVLGSAGPAVALGPEFRICESGMVPGYAA